MVKELAEAESVIEALSLKKVGKPVDSKGGGKVVEEAQVSKKVSDRSRTATKKPGRQKSKN